MIILPLRHPYSTSSLITPTAPKFSRAGRELESLQWHRRLGLKRVAPHPKIPTGSLLSCLSFRKPKPLAKYRSLASDSRLACSPRESSDM